MATDFGTDLSLWPDIDPSGATVSGFTCLAQALLRRLTTPRGGLFYDPGYGTDIRGYLGESMTNASAGSIQNAIEREITQDERITSAVVTATINLLASIIVVHITLQTALGPFTLVLAVSSVTVTLLKAG
jgi:phage baseplate assembly protein W